MIKEYLLLAAASNLKRLVKGCKQPNLSAFYRIFERIYRNKYVNVNLLTAPKVHRYIIRGYREINFLFVEIVIPIKMD